MFVSQFAGYLKARGYDVCFELKPGVDVIVLIDPRMDLQNKAFGMEEILDYKDRHPGAKVLHRINECDQRKATSFMDELLAQANKAADYTVFISKWLRDYHARRWFTVDRPHCVIYNGADPRVFHPVGRGHYRDGDVFRVVTHHWSNNVLKGFDVYGEIDEALARGQLEGVEFLLIGRWPDGTEWKATELMEPIHGVALAQALRRCHAYVTASRWEPCGMRHVEGAQCGLPMLYHSAGGGIVEAGERYGIAFDDGQVVGAIEQMRRSYDTYSRKVLEAMPCGDRMVMDFANVVQYLLA